VDLAFWREGVPYSRIEIPVEITRIVCADPPSIRTVDGTIYSTVSDADMIESKVVALLHRVILQHRDIVDLFLFQNHFQPDSAVRLKEKLKSLGISRAAVQRLIEDLKGASQYPIRAIQEIVDTQLEPVAAAQINAAGGGRIILGAVCGLLDRYLSDLDDKEVT
jgi:hypothetical protein